MKRILYSCLFFIFAQLTNYTLSQNFSIGYSFGAPGVSVQCISASGNTMHAEVIGPCPFATSYTWSAKVSQGACTPTITNVSQYGVANIGTSVTIVFAPNCCGQFTIEAVGLNSNLPPPGVVCGPGGGAPAASYTPQIICANSGVTLSPTNSIVCAGYPAVLSAVGGTAYTLTGPNTAPVNTVNNTPSFTVNPTATSVYTLVGTTPQGCQAQTTQTVTVHSATINVTPASQTICLGSVICFTAKAGAVTAGTSTYNIDWLAPGGGPPFANGLTTCTNAAGGTYSAVLSYSSPAVNCVATATANVSISTSINVSVPANFSMCPNNSTTLTANSIATNYTWTAPDGSSVTTNPAVFTPTVAGCYTVDADYSGCPGQNQVCISFYTLNATLASSSPSSCPGQSHTLTASGGNEYTFYYNSPYNSPNWVAISSLSTTSTFTNHTPPSLPAKYSVVTYSNGCTGSTTITLNAITLSPTVAASTASVCPNTPFTLTAGNVGAGTNYSFEANYTPTMANGTKTFVATFGGPAKAFYTYTVIADSANCRGMDSIKVYKKIQYPKLAASTPSVCPNTTFTLTETKGGAGTTYTFVADYLTAPGTSVIPNPPSFSAKSVTVKPTSVTPYRKYYVNVDSAGCKGTDTLRVYRLDLGTTINLHLNAPTNSVCPNNTFTLITSSGPGTSVQITYLGPPALPLPVTVNSATHILTPTQLAANGTYTVKADSSTCTGTSTLIVRKFKITPILAASPNPVCSAVPVTLTTSGLTTATTTTFKFYESGTLLQSSQSPTYGVNPGPTVNTTYVVVADSSNCIDSANVLVTITPSLVLNPSSSSPTICSGVDFTLSVSGPTNALYYWFEPAQTGSNQIAGPLTINQATDGIVPPNMTVTTTYTVKAVDPAGCDGYATITVSVNPGAQLTLTVTPQNATICPQQQDTLYASGAVNYTWSPSGSLSPNVFSYSVIAAPPATQVYTVIGNNGFGCFGRATTTVYVNTKPQLSVAPAPAWSVCPGFTSTLTAFGANSYTWSSQTSTTVVMQQSIAAQMGDCFTLTGSNGGSCISFSTNVCVGQAPPLVIKVVSANNIYTTCIESNTPKFSKPVILNASGAGSYVWFPYNPIHMTYSIGPSTTVRPPTTTNYTVIGNTSVCSGSAAVTVTVIQQFTMGVSPPLPAICLGDTISLKPINISTVNVAGPQSKFSYYWAEAGNAPPISISSYFAPTVQVHPENTTTYTLEIADARGCYSTPRLITVTVLPRPITSVAIPTINGVPTRSLCYVGLNPGPPDVVLTLVANNENTNLQFGVVPTYSWYAPYKDHNSILTPPNNNQIIVNAPLRAPASVVYTVVSGFNGVPGCYRRDTVHVSVVDCRPIKKVLFTTAETLDTICTQECVTFVNLTDTMAGNPQKVEWVFRGGNPPVSTYSAPTVCYNLPGRYDVILKVENPYPLADGGSSLAIGQLSYIKVVDVPNITIVPPGNLRSDTTVRFGTSVALKGTGGLTYNWSPNYNISSLSNANVTVKPFRTTQYILTGFNSKRCASRDTINVIVIEDCGEMYVPNAFSPNGDGHNDVLKVNGICLQTMTFMIFNRWGEKIFETNEQNVGWDGTYKGDEMNSGVFVYRLEGKTYDGKAYSSKGNITLIR